MGTIYRNGVPFVGSGGAGGVEMTQAEYDLLPTSEKMNGAIYFITDGDVSYPTASQMRYDNTESQIPSTTVQGAIDENRIAINSLNNMIVKIQTTSATSVAVVVGEHSMHFLLVGSPNGSAYGTYFVIRTTGNVSFTQINQGSNLTAAINGSSLNLTFNDNTARAMDIVDIIIRGTAVSV